MFGETLQGWGACADLRTITACRPGWDDAGSVIALGLIVGIAITLFRSGDWCPVDASGPFVHAAVLPLAL